MPGPCRQWIAASDLSCSGTGSGATDDAALAAQLASDLLYVWSGRRYAGAGACRSTARPGSRARHAWPLGAYWLGHRWNFTCGCRHSDRVVLPGYPVTAVLDVVIDGALLDAAAYRVEQSRYLVRQDGSWWPACQDDDAPLGSLGTWSVRYEHGADPPAAGVAAAKTLACELLRAMSGGKCVLPSGVTKVTRQGVSYERVLSAFGPGRVTTGLALVDAFLGTYNPGGQRARTLVWSPDVPHARRV